MVVLAFRAYFQIPLFRHFSSRRAYADADRQVRVGANLRYRRDHFRGQPFAGKGNVVHAGFIAQHILTQFADAPVFNLVVGRFVNIVLNQPPLSLPIK